MLQPVAHALMQAREDLTRVVSQMTDAQLWSRPGGAAAAGFHVKHAMGSLDRLMTYARGEPLSAAQRSAFDVEYTDGDPASALLERAQNVIDSALEQLKGISPDSLFEPREIGRARLPSNVIGVLVHAAEHTARHVGQLITTAKIVQSTLDKED